MTPTLTPPPETVAPFAADERCDRCSAAAKLRVRLAEGGEPVVSSRALLWATVGILIMTIIVVALVIGTAARR